MLNRSYFQQIEKIWGEADIDLFADRLTTQKKVYVSWKPDPKALTTDAFTMQWADQKNLCVPSILPGGSLPSQSSKGSGISHVDCASLASSDVVSDTVGNVGISPDSVTSIGGPIAYLPRSSTSIDSVKWADSSGVESLRGRLQPAGFSQESSDLLLESRRSGTRTAYKAPWKSPFRLLRVYIWVARSLYP